MALKWKFPRSSLAAALLITSIACSAGEDENALGAFTCSRGDVPEQFFRQTEGSVTAGQLADLADDPGVRRAELEAAGMVDGYFSYWSESVDRPPFDPPLDLVCQSLLMENAEQAEAWVVSLEPGPSVFASTALAFLPDGGRTVVELDGGDDERVFALTAEGDGEVVRMIAVVRSDGRVVQSVYLGNSDAGATVEEARAVSNALAARVATLDQP